MKLVRNSEPEWVYDALRKYFPETIEQNENKVCALVILEHKTNVVSEVVVFPGYTIVVGRAPTLGEALVEGIGLGDFDGSVTMYRHIMHDVFEFIDSASKYATYIQVGEGGDLIDYHPEPGVILLDMDFHPSSPPTPSEMRDYLSGETYGSDVEGFSPLLDLLERISDPVRKDENE